MKLFVAVIGVLLVVGLSAPAVNAQIPNVEFHFKGYGEAIPACKGVDVMDNAFIVANNFNMWMSAIEYKVLFCEYITFLSDDTGGLNIGSSPDGISTAWPLPQNAFGNFIANKITFKWNCEGCPSQNISVQVQPHPYGGVRAVRWPDNAIIDAVGMTALICPTIPIEETSWGRVKALYNR